MKRLINTHPLDYSVSVNPPGDTLFYDYASGDKIRIKTDNHDKFSTLMKQSDHSVSWFKVHDILDRMRTVYGNDTEAMRKAIQNAGNK